MSIEVECVLIEEKRLKTKTPMRERPPEDRIHDFEEVAIGYSPSDAIKESERCLQCVEPGCIRGCPVGIEIPEFIKSIREEDLEHAISIIKDRNSLPAICGRVCPQESQCELTCSHCGLCWLYCPEGCLVLNDKGFFEPDYKYCKGCGICAKVCPIGAINMEVEVR